MSIIENLLERLHHPQTSHEHEEDSLPITRNLDEIPTAKPFVDQRVWFSEPSETIITQHKIFASVENQTFITTISTMLTKAQFDVLAEQIQTIHSSEKASDVAYFYAYAHCVLNNMDPSSIVIMATTISEEKTEIPIGYAYISGTPPSPEQLRQVGVMVIPDFRNKGIAFLLFKDLLSHAAEFGITKLQITFRTENKPIWRFLNKAANSDHRLITFKSEVFGPDTVATIEILSPTINP